MASLEQAIRAFDPDLAIERAWTPPASWYTDPAIHALEQSAVWDRTWQLVAFEHQLRQPGDWVSAAIGALQVVVVRDGDGVLRALHNVCRHKGTMICQGTGHGTELVCPYHGWSYELDGRLKRAPLTAGIRDFERAEMALPALRVEAWGPLVFVNAAEAAPLSAALGPLREALEQTGWDGLRYAGSKSWDIDCNWKVFCDNYLDGGYHVSHIHPALGEQLDMASYRTELFGCFSVQSAAGGEAERIGSGALYAWIYPGTMINRYGPVLDINRVFPVAPDRCVVHFDWWFDAGCDEDFIGQSMAQSEDIQREDLEISERVQQGLRSGAFDRGRYAPRLEMAMHHFHQLLSRDLQGALAAGAS